MKHFNWNWKKSKALWVAWRQEEIHYWTKQVRCKYYASAMLTTENRSAFSLSIRLDLARSDLCWIEIFVIYTCFRFLGKWALDVTYASIYDSLSKVFQKQIVTQVRIPFQECLHGSVSK